MGSFLCTIRRDYQKSILITKSVIHKTYDGQVAQAKAIQKEDLRLLRYFGDNYDYPMAIL